MRKFYSIVLMAAALLVGTNAWAEDQDQAWLQAAINALRGGSGTVTLENDIVLSSPIWIGPEDGSVDGAAPSVILNLNGHKITRTVSDATDVYMFVIGKGTLDVRKGQIRQLGNGATTSSNVFTMYGTYNKVANYSNLIIGSDVQVSAVNGTIIAVMEKAVSSGKYKGAYGQVFTNPNNAGFVTSYPATKGYGFAFGVNVEVNGKLQVNGGSKCYGIKTNGFLAYPDGEVKRSDLATSTKAYEAGVKALPATLDDTYNDYVPYVHVGPTAEIKSDNMQEKSAAIYASGYAKWLIEGTCDGNIGASISSGEVDIKDAVITSSAGSYSAPNGGQSVSGAGSAVVINSRDNYAGHIDVTISGNTQVSATSGYAIQEKINTGNDKTKVDEVRIESGTFSGGNSDDINGGAISIDNGTLTDQDADVIVISAAVDGTIQVDGAAATEAQVSTILNSGSGVHAEPDPNDPNKTIIVITPATISVTLNGCGFATFSATTAVKLPTGLRAFAAEYLSLEQTLLLREITVEWIPANTGMILFGTEDNAYNLTTPDSEMNGLSEIEDNDLQPASAWGSRDKNNNRFFVLSGDKMYQYVGETMKENKAYLPVALQQNAPERFRMVFAEEDEATAIENVEVEAVKAEKFIENGQLFIRRGENLYNVQGQIVK